VLWPGRERALTGRAAIIAASLIVALGGCGGGHARRTAATRARGPQLYVAQAATGVGDGSTCANAKAAAWFDALGSWGTRAGEIGPGVTVNLCGTITSPLVVHGSGTSTSAITIHWQPGATLSEPHCPAEGSGCLNTDGNSYLMIDGGVDGSIQSTANGTELPDHVDAVLGILALKCNGCTIEHLTIENMYVHVYDSAHRDDTDAGVADGIWVSGSDVTIARNTFHDLRNAINADWNTTDSDDRITGNDIYDIDGGILASPQQSGGDVGPIFIDHNHIHDFANWDTASDAYHHDGVHCFTSETAAGTPAHYSGVYIYDNTFGGATDTGRYGDADNMTAEIFLQGAGGTECADGSSPFYVFNNVFSTNYYVNNGLLALSSGVPHVYNNSILGGRNDAGAGYAYGGAVGAAFIDNVITTAHELMYTSGAARDTFASGSPDYNLYADGGLSPFVCRNAVSFVSFHSWRGCIGGDVHSQLVPDAMLNGDGSPQAGSPALGAGTNLTSLCTGDLVALCSDIDGRPRPKTGPWDIGAYQRS
jgi:hypothetical protein